MHPRTGWDWFKLWILLILLLSLLWYIFFADETPLSKWDLSYYVNKRDCTTETIEQGSDKTIDAVPMSSYSSMSPEELRDIKLNYIPNVVDFVEDD